MEKQYKSLIIKQLSPDSRVFYIYLNNPSRGNALSPDFFTEFPDAVASLDQNPDVTVIILTGAGKHFCSGIELETLNSNTGSSESTGPGHAAEKLRREIKVMQRAVNAIEECRKPVIALIHGACIGGGVDIASACDIRYCMQSTFFSVKEVDMALAADLGSLQRLPRIVGFGNAMELALTGRRFTGLEAKELGLVTRVFGTKQDMDQGVESIAEDDSRMNARLIKMMEQQEAKRAKKSSSALKVTAQSDLAALETIVPGVVDSGCTSVPEGAGKKQVISMLVEDSTPQGVIHVHDSSEDLIPLSWRKRKATYGPEGGRTASLSPKSGDLLASSSAQGQLLRVTRASILWTCLVRIFPVCVWPCCLFLTKLLSSP